MFKSRNVLRAAAVALTAMSLSGAVASAASAAEADTVFKELEYRGNTSKPVMTAPNFNGASVVLAADTNSRFG